MFFVDFHVYSNIIMKFQLKSHRNSPILSYIVMEHLHSIEALIMLSIASTSQIIIFDNIDFAINDEEAIRSCLLWQNDIFSL